MSDYDEWNKILGIEQTTKHEIYDLSENSKWYSGNKSKEECLKELLAVWNNKRFIVADV
jgi:hypothetical protein